MKALVLGRPGFIGSALVDHLHDHEIAFVCPTNTFIEEGRTFCGTRSDLADPDFRDRLSRWQPDVVIDLGAVNRETAKQALDGLRGIAPSFVLVSSISVYRRYGAFLRRELVRADHNVLLRESDPLRQKLFVYRQLSGAASDPARIRLANYEKIAAEETFRGAHDIGVQVLRLPMIFGPGDPDRRVQSYVKRLRTGPIVMTSLQAAWRQSRCFVRDAAKAIVSAAVRASTVGSSDIFHVSDGANLS